MHINFIDILNFDWFDPSEIVLKRIKTGKVKWSINQDTTHKNSLLTVSLEYFTKYIFY